MKNIDKHLQNKNFLNLYLIFGNEDFLKKSYEKKFLDLIVLPETKLMNFDFFEGKNVTAETIINTADTIPFMAENRLIIVKNSGLFFEGRKAETEKLCSYISKIPKTTIIVFFEESVDKRLKVFKELQKNGYATEINYLGEAELSNWVSNVFKENKKKIDTATIVYLIRFVGYEMELIFNEVNKLLDYKKDEEFILKEDIDKICTKSLETTIFELVDAIGNKNSQLAINLYNNLIFNKTSPFMILNMISRQFRLILQTKYLAKLGFNNSEIATELSSRDFIIKRCLSQSKNFTNKILLNAIDDFLKTDVKIKTGEIDDVMGVELLVIKYSSIS